jgi:hypothetical protein
VRQASGEALEDGSQELAAEVTETRRRRIAVRYADFALFRGMYEFTPIGELMDFMHLPTLRETAL